MPIKVINNSFSDEKIIASGNVKDLVKAIKYAEKMGAVICNISLNTTVDNQELKETIKSTAFYELVNREPQSKNLSYIDYLANGNRTIDTISARELPMPKSSLKDIV